MGIDDIVLTIHCLVYCKKVIKIITVIFMKIIPFKFRFLYFQANTNMNLIQKKYDDNIQMIEKIFRKFDS